MTNIPNRLSTDKRSVFYDPCYVRVGVRFNGEERDDVHEYNVTAGWITVRERNEAGKYRITQSGSYALTVLHGTVEPYWKRPPVEEPIRHVIEHNDDAHINAAEAKRARRAAKRAALAERNRSS